MEEVLKKIFLFTNKILFFQPKKLSKKQGKNTPKAQKRKRIFRLERGDFLPDLASKSTYFLSFLKPSKNTFFAHRIAKKRAFLAFFKAIFMSKAAKEYDNSKATHNGVFKYKQ